MSFILDALKKSETERQQQTGAEFSSIPSSSGESQSFKWLWILALLLIVNIAVLLGILLRPDKAPEAPVPAETVPAEPAAVESSPVEQTFEERVAEARQNQPPPESPAANPSPSQEPAVQPVVQQATVPGGTRLMTIDELRLNGSLQLPELHVDLHVYADDPAERFVFINMAKHRENSRLDEGPVVAEITTDGVVLEYQGRKFLLPRE
jgi:general secretion pathway protein B